MRVGVFTPRRQLRALLPGLSAVLLLLATGCEVGEVGRTGPTTPDDRIGVGGTAPPVPALAPGSARPGREVAGFGEGNYFRPNLVPRGDVDVAGPRFSVQMLEGGRFSPQELTVTTGAIVRWHNADNVPHTVTMDPRALPPGVAPFNSGPIPPGATFAVEFIVPGTYRYISQLPPGTAMSGTVIVLGS